MVGSADAVGALARELPALLDTALELVEGVGLPVDVLRSAAVFDPPQPAMEVRASTAQAATAKVRVDIGAHPTRLARRAVVPRIGGMQDSAVGFQDEDAQFVPDAGEEEEGAPGATELQLAA